jgi:hypothetical protein
MRCGHSRQVGADRSEWPKNLLKSLFKVFLKSHKYLAGMECKARGAANSPCYPQAPQRRRPPGKALARRVEVKSGD